MKKRKKKEKSWHVWKEKKNYKFRQNNTTFKNKNYWNLMEYLISL